LRLGAGPLVSSKEGKKGHTEMKTWLLPGETGCFDTAVYMTRFVKGRVYTPACREKTNLNLTCFDATGWLFPGLLRKHQSQVRRRCIGLKAFAQTLCLE